jgi:HK97 gp10 family phage protein
MASNVTDKDMGWSAIMKGLSGSGADKLSAYVGPDPADITSDIVTHRAKYSKVVTGIDTKTHSFIVRKDLVRAGSKEVLQNQRAYYPMFLEFGTRKMAARPFIRWTLDAHDNYTEQLRQLAGNAVKKAKDGNSFSVMAASLRRLADSVARDIKNTIVGMGLIDTGRMYRSVRCLRVVEGDGELGGSISANWGTP